MTATLALFLALVGNAILSLGMVLQKRHVGWIGGKGDAVQTNRRRDQVFWGLGFFLMNIQPVFNWFALLGLPANIVAAAAGSNVAFTALFSVPLLGERMGKRGLSWTALLFSAIALAGFRGGASGGAFRIMALWLALALPLGVGLVLLGLRRKRGAVLATGIAAAAGALGGSMLLSLGALGLASGSPSLGWLASPYLYSYLVGGISAFGLVQIAYKDGSMSSTAPAYYGLQVLWPALASYFVFGVPFDPFQFLAFALICLSVVRLASSAGR